MSFEIVSWRQRQRSGQRRSCEIFWRTLLTSIPFALSTTAQGALLRTIHPHLGNNDTPGRGVLVETTSLFQPTTPSTLRIENLNANLCFMAQDHPTALPPNPAVEYYKCNVDRSLLQENSKLFVEQRFRQLQELQRFTVVLKETPRLSKCPVERSSSCWQHTG